MEFIPQKNLSLSYDTQVDSMNHLQSQLIHHENKTQNHFSILNQTLSNLNDDTLKRYNTDINTTSIEFALIDSKPSKTTYYNRQFKSHFDQSFVPQPWFNVDSHLMPGQSPLTQIRQRNSDFHSLSKSFKLSKNVNNNNSQNGPSNQDSASSHIDKKRKQLNFKSEKRKERRNNFLTEQSQNCVQSFATYNYSSEQKARMTLEQLVQRKKNIKMSKLLRMKTHSFDNTVQKQQKFTNKSKDLIEGLYKFSSDNLLKKSIDRAVDVLKKRTQTIMYKKSKSKKQFRRTSLNEYQVNWLSLHKIVVNSGKEQENIIERSRQEKDSHTCLISQDMRPKMIGEQRAIKTQIKSKITFRPKRSHLIERRDLKCGDKQFRNTKISHRNDGLNTIANYPAKSSYGIIKFDH